MLSISKNLRRLGIVSVSALMLLGIGASATSAHNNVHADDIAKDIAEIDQRAKDEEYGGPANAAAHDKFYAASDAEVAASEGEDPYTTGNVSSILSHDQIAKIVQRDKEDNGNYVPSPSDFQGNGWLAHDGLNNNGDSNSQSSSTQPSDNTTSSQSQNVTPSTPVTPTPKPVVPVHHQDIHHQVTPVQPASTHHTAPSQSTKNNDVIVVNHQSHHHATTTPSSSTRNTQIIMPKPTTHRAIASVAPNHAVNTTKTTKHIARHVHVNKMQQQINRLQRELRKIAKSIQQFKNQGMKHRGQSRNSRVRKHMTRHARRHQSRRAHRTHNHRHVNK